MKKAIVIGSGFGGLAIAIRLQARGFQVTILEKNELPGGHAYQFTQDGYTFDMGPSLVTAPSIINEIFASAGKKLEDYLELIPLDPYYRIYFHDKSYIDYSGNSEDMKSQMAKFSTRDSANYDKFIENSRLLYEAIITDGLGSTPFNKISTMLKFVPNALKISAFSNSYKLAEKYFEDFRHRFMFSFHPLFIGGNPFRVPAIYLMISYLEKKDGVWFTKGGMYSLVKAFTELFKELGGELITSSPVDEIISENKIVKGVIANNKQYEADLVVSNADVNHTYKTLLRKEKSKKWNDSKLARADYSMGTFLLYLGVKKKYPQLLHHTLILSHRYKALVDDIFDNNVLPDDFSMYLHVPSRSDSTMAPDGGESIYVLVPCTNLKANIDWSTQGRIFANKLVNFLESDFNMIDLRKNIEIERYYTPVDFQNERNSYLGTPWGMEPTLLQSAYFRPHNKSEDFKNLYLVGAGTHPGAGLPGVMLGASATEKLIIEDF